MNGYISINIPSFIKLYLKNILNLVTFIFSRFTNFLLNIFLKNHFPFKENFFRKFISNFHNYHKVRLNNIITHLVEIWTFALDFIVKNLCFTRVVSKSIKFILKFNIFWNRSTDIKSHVKFSRLKCWIKLNLLCSLKNSY